MRAVRQMAGRAIRKGLLFLFDVPSPWATDGHNNLHRIPYTARDLPQSDPPSLLERLRNVRRRRRYWPLYVLKQVTSMVFMRMKTMGRNLSPRYLAARAVGIVVEERASRALSLLPEILSNEIPEVDVVDCGAAENYNPIWDHLGPKVRIHMFEPEPGALKKLLRDYGDDPRLRIHNTLVSSKAQPLILNVYLWPRGSSIFAPNRRFVDQTYMQRHFELVARETFPAAPLADVLDGVDVSFVKADVEGAELEVLRGAEKLLPGCVGVELEIWYNRHILDGGPLCTDVIRFCHDHGFSLIWINTPRVWHFLLPSPDLESKGFAGQGDALFFRMPHDVVDLVARGLWRREKLAIAACIYLVYGHYEFAFHLMELAVSARLLAPEDRVVACTRECVRLFAGHERLLSYQKLKAALHWLEGSDPNASLRF